MLRPILRTWATRGVTAAVVAAVVVAAWGVAATAQGAPSKRATGLRYAASDAATPAGRRVAKGVPGGLATNGPASRVTSSVTSRPAPITKGRGEGATGAAVGGAARGALVAPTGAMRGVVRGVSVDTAAASASITRRTEARREVTIDRETFQYDDGGRRDPFLSLLGTSELRPMISDLRLAVVVYDPRGNSRAVLRDISQGPNGKPQSQYYSVRVGQTLGRMRVAAIGAKSVTFTILEFGESRQETLALNDSTKVRTP